MLHSWTSSSTERSALGSDLEHQKATELVEEGSTTAESGGLTGGFTGKDASKTFSALMNKTLYDYGKKDEKKANSKGKMCGLGCLVCVALATMGLSATIDTSTVIEFSEKNPSAITPDKDMYTLYPIIVGLAVLAACMSCGLAFAKRTKNKTILSKVGKCTGFADLYMNNSKMVCHGVFTVMSYGFTAGYLMNLQQDLEDTWNEFAMVSMATIFSWLAVFTFHLAGGLKKFEEGASTKIRVCNAFILTGAMYMLTGWLTMQMLTNWCSHRYRVALRYNKGETGEEALSGAWAEYLLDFRVVPPLVVVASVVCMANVAHGRYTKRSSGVANMENSAAYCLPLVMMWCLYYVMIAQAESNGTMTDDDAAPTLFKGFTLRQFIEYSFAMMCCVYLLLSTCLCRVKEASAL